MSEEKGQPCKLCEMKDVHGSGQITVCVHLTNRGNTQGQK